MGSSSSSSSRSSSGQGVCMGCCMGCCCCCCITGGCISTASRTGIILDSGPRSSVGSSSCLTSSAAAIPPSWRCAEGADVAVAAVPPLRCCAEGADVAAAAASWASFCSTSCASRCAMVDWRCLGFLLGTEAGALWAAEASPKAAMHHTQTVACHDSAQNSEREQTVRMAMNEGP